MRRATKHDAPDCTGDLGPIWVGEILAADYKLLDEKPAEAVRDEDYWTSA